MNKIQWQEWGAPVFEMARSTGKPILLDITGSWCHWCHVMDSTSYSDPTVIDVVNRHFIPVRVDTDKRPDVNRRYNMGGWPTTAFLDSEGRIITGGTYIPPQQLRGVLRSVLDHYAKNKGRVKSKLEPMRLPKATNDVLTQRITKDIATSIAVNFDIDYGGFGFEPKFPHPDALEFSLQRHRYHGEREMLTVVTRTLDKMGNGGIYDSVEGGFFRYSTTRDWRIPHFEKMAEDNAKLLAVYLQTFQVTGNSFYKKIAEGIVNYVLARLTDSNHGGFYGSQDADEEYYKLNMEARQKREPPRIDNSIYTNYNTFLISSFLLASVLLDRPSLKDFALKSLDRLLKEAWNGGRLLHYLGKEASEPSDLLVDHGPLLHSLLDSYEHTAQELYLQRAVELAEHSIKTLYDPKDSGFYDIPEPQSRLGELKRRDKPLDENSITASAFLRLSALTGGEKYSDIAAKTIRIFASEYERYGIMAGSYGIALDTFLTGPVTITIVGRKDWKGFEGFRQESLRMHSGKTSILYLDPTEEPERVRKLGYGTDDSVSAYVCVAKACGPPIKNPSQIESSIDSLLQLGTKAVTG